METRNAGPWKNLGAWLFIGFGAVIAMASIPATATPTVLLADMVLWPIDDGQSLTPESRLLAAILGGVMLGFGTTILLLVSRIYPREPQLVRAVILPGVWVWFVVDSLGSVAAGAPLNAVLNVGFLMAFLVPWWRVPASAEPAISHS